MKVYGSDLKACKQKKSGSNLLNCQYRFAAPFCRMFAAFAHIFHVDLLKCTFVLQVCLFLSVYGGL